MSGFSWIKYYWIFLKQALNQAVYIFMIMEERQYSNLFS